MPIALVIAPYHDRATSYTSVGAAAIADYLKKDGWHVIYLPNRYAVRSSLERYPNAKLIVYIGHGRPGALIGQPPGPLVTEEDVGIFANKTILAIACYGGTLGSAAVGAGAKGYMGWMDVVYVGGIERDHNYVSDFMSTFLAAALELSRGGSLKNALDEFVSACEYYEDLYPREKYDFWDTYKALMRHNRVNARIWTS